jgi:hypothetical protein
MIPVISGLNLTLFPGWHLTCMEAVSPKRLSMYLSYPGELTAGRIESAYIMHVV